MLAHEATYAKGLKLTPKRHVHSVLRLPPLTGRAVKQIAQAKVAFVPGHAFFARGRAQIPLG